MKTPPDEGLRLGGSRLFPNAKVALIKQIYVGQPRR